MKYPTLQKVSLFTIALVACITLSAQARDRVKVQSVRQHNKGQSHKPFAAASLAGKHTIKKIWSTYVLDDGSMEDSVGFGNGLQNFQSLWFNQFQVIPGQTSISAVEVAWGTPLFPDPSLNGTPVTIAVWSDPNGDGNPSDAALLASVAGTIQSAGTDTFVVYTFSPPVDVSAYSSFFIGDLTPMNNGPENFPQGLDENSTLQRRSWIAAMSDGSDVDINNPGNNDFLGLIDDFGLPGNWGIRGDTGTITPTPTPTPTATPTPTTTPAGALWYNGDFDFVDGLANEQDTFAQGYSHIYDDFNVPDSMGWDVNSVFSHDLISTTVTGATWEIRSGVSNGNGGTIVASGTTVAPVVTPTGNNAFGFDEFQVEVDGLNVHLDGNGATYFLNVTPIGSLDGGRSFDSTTSGANCIGTPCGNNSNSFWDSDLFGVFFVPTNTAGSQFHDFSMGVNGMVSGGGGGLTLTGAVSRKNHQASGNFSINLPSDGSGIEDRQGDGSQRQLVIFTFSEAVDSISGATTSCGKVKSTAIHGNSVSVQYDGKCNAMDVTVTVNDITSGSDSLPSASVSYGILQGDVNFDGVVDATDAQAVADHSHNSGPVDSTDFQYDVTDDGFINQGDRTVVKGLIGTSLP
ncbi:MAG TPA: dockerin type I domain-containing protein [Chthoniobacterales bacterium]|jgi:hypothetical protein